MAVSCCCRLAKALWGEGKLRPGQTPERTAPSVPRALFRGEPTLPGAPLDRSVGKEAGLGVSPVGDLAEGDEGPGHQTTPSFTKGRASSWFSCELYRTNET